MGSYIPSTPDERRQMLAALGKERIEDLFSHISEEVQLGRPLAIPNAKSELEVSATMQKMAAKNRVFRTCFRGAGAYRHYIPSIVKTVTAKEEFLTSYTPYQAEISQGVLQSIFEYQTMICELTGMDVSNASVYDGAAAAAEAVAMCRDRKKDTAYVSEAVHPDTMKTVRTYCEANGTKVVPIPLKNGKTDANALKTLMKDGAACVLIQHPNYFGLLEDCEEMTEIAHNNGSKLILSCNPISLGLLKTPGEYGADIAVGEGQPLGIPLSFGGPYLGFMACKKDMMRKLPGRIVGETVDVDGKRAFVLTLQAREQHIRREKASSNICSNQALCAMTSAVYMAAMGPQGVSEVARQCMAKAGYAAERLTEIEGIDWKHEGAFFHEFVTVLPIAAEELAGKLAEQDVLSGLPVGEKEMLWCVTEMNTKEEIDTLVSLVKEVCGR